MNALKTALLVLAMTALIHIVAVAQNTSDWRRFQANGTEFSIEMPGKAELFVDKDGFVAWEARNSSGIHLSEMQLLSGSADATMMWLETYRADSASRAMRILVGHTNLKARDIENLPKGFSGKEVEKNSQLDYILKKEVPISLVQRFYASKKYLYVVTALRRGAKNATFERFLNSVRLNEVDSGSINLSALDSYTLDDIGVEAVKETEPAKTPTKPIAPNPEDDSSPLLVVLKARAPYTNRARQNGVTGEVLLRATFQVNGRISKIELIEGLPDGLNRSAFFATMRMKYLPPEKDGAFEETAKKISYGYSIY